ncbi:MAG: hypothetical protein J6C64_10860 [Lachnospiraceae bacterium]|nr:hypothetical protein [Lachnospiraceae bacterium]
MKNSPQKKVFVLFAASFLLLILNQIIMSQKSMIEKYQAENDRYRQQLSEYESMEEITAESGFVKKGGVYLINDESQMELLAGLIKENKEIEPGVLAAKARYRLQNNLYLDDWFSLGTETFPFNGMLDGDNHRIFGNFALGDYNNAECFMVLGEQAQTANLYVSNCMHRDSEIFAAFQNASELEEICRNLRKYPDCRPKFSVQDYLANTEELAELLKENWNRNKGSNGYFFEVKFEPERYENGIIPVSISPFMQIPDEEMQEIMRLELTASGSFLSFIRLECLEGLNICTFAVCNSGEWKEYHVLLQGMWEGKEIPLQHLMIPRNQNEDAYFYDYHIQKEDINFDGKKDLMVHEGYSYGSGGEWDNYCGIIFNGEYFSYYPSFPEQFNFFEPYCKRIISFGQVGAYCPYVLVYEVVNGEYRLTRQLSYHIGTEGEGNILYYYEMEELVCTHIITGGYDEIRELYPDLSNYWNWRDKG